MLSMFDRKFVDYTEVGTEFDNYFSIYNGFDRGKIW